MTTTCLEDKRTNSFSYITELRVKDYLRIAEAAYADKGGIEGQREPLTTQTAKRIRSRMIEDLAEGAVLPPIVVGVTLPKDKFRQLPLDSSVNILDFIPTDRARNLAIIDGMQRTTALFKAISIKPEVLNNIIRIEFWFAKTAHSLVYRMLILNTGQVPWTISRQLSVVYRSLVADITENVGNIDRVISPDTKGRRTKGGEIRSDILVEMYLSFSSRKLNVDTKEKVFEQFAQLDFVENLSRHEFQQQFYTALRLFIELDKAFSAYDPGSDAKQRFLKGRNIFDSHPARLGFIVAVGTFVIGRAGDTRPEDIQNDRLKKLKSNLAAVADKISSMRTTELGHYLQLELLEERLTVRSGKVGDHERKVFERAFEVLITDNVDLTSMKPCWIAY